MRARTEVKYGPIPVCLLLAGFLLLPAGYVAGQVTIPNASSREFSVMNNRMSPSPTIPVGDGFSREFTAMNNRISSPQTASIRDAFSREFTAMNNRISPPPMSSITGAFSREFTDLNNRMSPPPGVAIADAFSRYFTVFNRQVAPPGITDAASRMFTIWNYFPASGVAAKEDIPAVLTVLPARPNPSTGATLLTYGLPQERTVSLEVFDASGRRMAAILSSVRQTPGWHRVQMSEPKWGSGIYFFRFQADAERKTGKFLLSR